MKFCGECGSPLSGISVSTLSASTTAEAGERATERRLVSVLFADRVGFTALSESRDPEEVRELLSTYFEVARSFVERYGGTVEKFIGDAVMAVWGTPVANEDDAERAVRAALDLVDAVSSLGEEVRARGLNARAGVLTGEAAVNLGAEGQGMVAGDLVNTASRIQSVAEPGTVLVGETTKRATEAAIAYEEADQHALKGKAEPVPLYRALRVTAGRAGALKSEGLEPPFVGRERELRLLKELFHASAEEGKAHLVSVVGIAGIGKSRLAWEFYKYIDGLAELIFWHRGRCLAYGEGVTYWALAEIVRMRAELAERHPSWGAGKRNLSALYLEPLSTAAMGELLSGFVPGLSDELREQILARAEGVPLYAVETVRMLLDRGLLEREGERYRPTGTIEALEVPETLHALVAARLDGLEAEERRVIQDAAVLGKSFTKAGLAALSGLS